MDFEKRRCIGVLDTLCNRSVITLQPCTEAVSKIRSDVSYDQSVKLNWEAKLDASKVARIVFCFFMTVSFHKAI